MADSSQATLDTQAEVTHWERGEGWAGLVAQQLRGADILVIPTDMSRVLLQGAADYIVHHDWHRGRLSVFRGQCSGTATSTLGAISMAALPFGWTLPGHMARWRTAAHVLHRYLGLKGRMHKNPITDLDAWDMAPERTVCDVYDLLVGAATGQRRCSIGVVSREGSVGPADCWKASASWRGLCDDHAPGGELAWRGYTSAAAYEAEGWQVEDDDVLPGQTIAAQAS